MKPKVYLPKLEDVAARARVSAATVSRFHNNPSIVADSTAERIRKAILETGYVPDLIAGGLASRRSRLVAILVPEIAHSIFNDTIEALASELVRDGLIAILGLTGKSDQDMGKHIDAAIARRAEAIILSGPVTNSGLRSKLQKSGATVIETWDLPANPIDIAVGFSHVAVGADIARFVVNRGYRRPFLVVGASPRSLVRRDSFIAEWKRNSRARPTQLTIEPPVLYSHARACWRHAMELKPRPDIVVCSSDLLAHGMIVEAYAAGAKVPQDIAIVGFGNMAIAGEMRPTITSVDLDGARIGREAVAVLRKRAAGQKSDRRVIDVGFRLVARESA